MIDTDKYEGHPCKWCGYYEDANAWHYEECPIFDDPMMKHHIAEVKRLRKRLEVIEDFMNDELRAFVNSNTFDHIYDAIEKKLEVKE